MKYQPFTKRLFAALLCFLTFIPTTANAGLNFFDKFEGGNLFNDWETDSQDWFLQNGQACELEPPIEPPGMLAPPLVSLQSFTGPVSGSAEITQVSLDPGAAVGFSPKAIGPSVNPNILVGYVAFVGNVGGNIVGQIFQVQVAPPNSSSAK